ncbi:GTPase required for pre-60S ribosomal subunit nuclear export and maturation [Puccinia graminis f. sp. tritici]|uniref:Nucleolar GTP-binding protein 2 n=1 Tax=Puccinia graminis f. sp. tritici TaxID=56615 RepID=A0A5B0MGJ7_PUCGR|nr:GTPase required for pre-60S ribosomal subunit nuclear export and maturation [Puccinia graminis f. sp. tritici]KAA1074950.1 GTPase required for pre-60S ribosomal subunit nuclear export and maturation [Puccinia graminis f. sp. tritici]
MTAKPKSSGKSRSSTSAGPVKQHVKGENFYRDAKKAKTVKLLSKDGGKAIRDRDGKIIKAAAFQSSDAPNGRIQPDRRWFGNTRVISQKALDHFRTSLAQKQADPYSVILKQNKLPMSLLQSDAEKAAQGGKGMKVDLVTAEPFEQTFGPKQRRKRPRLSTAGTFEELVKEAEDLNANKKSKSLAGEKLPPVDGLGKFIKGGEEQLEEADSQEDDEQHNVAVDYILSAGTSKRIWSELYKVIDSSDVILHVLDARDPLGTRCLSVENYLQKEKRGKKMVWILNKVDLVPGWVASRWVKYLSKFHPTIAFHASINNSFGKGSLIQLLRQFSSLFSDRKQISVGFIGYPNVGKSSIINTLKKKKVCNVAPIPGETKVWQYITLMRRIYLIDCPGIVPPSAKDSEAAKVLKGVVRVEHLSCPADHIPPLLDRIRPEYMVRTYGIQEWQDSEDFLTQIARKSGKLLKGGEPDLRTVATCVLNDWIRGKIPYFVPPPTQTPGFKTQNSPEEKDQSQLITEQGSEEGKQTKKSGREDGEDKVGVIKGVTQPLHQIVRTNKFLEDDEIGEFEYADEEGGEGAERLAKSGSKGEAAVTEEIDSEEEEKDEDDLDLSDSGEWSGIGSEDEDEEELCYEDLIKAPTAKSTASSNALASDLNDDDDDDEDLDIVLDETEPIRQTGQVAKASKAAGKRKGNQEEEVDLDGSVDRRNNKKTKEPRMTTNKKKSENFFTNANVKNKNRNRKVPKLNTTKKKK